MDRQSLLRASMYGHIKWQASTEGLKLLDHRDRFRRACSVEGINLATSTSRTQIYHFYCYVVKKSPQLKTVTYFVRARPDAKIRCGRNSRGGKERCLVEQFQRSSWRPSSFFMKPCMILSYDFLNRAAESYS